MADAPATTASPTNPDPSTEASLSDALDDLSVKVRRAVSAEPPEEAEARLLPGGDPPELAALWIEGRWDRTDNDVQARQLRVAAEWAVEALCHAHQSAKLKATVRQLLAVHHFTNHLDTWDAAGFCFRDVLKVRLKARLVELGAHLAAEYPAAAPKLTADVLARTIGSPADHRLAAAAAAAGRKPTQIDVLPAVEPVVFGGGRLNGPPESGYAHALLMLANVLDQPFQDRVAAVVAEHNLAWEGHDGTAQHMAAPPKAFARVMTKAASDYRLEPRPVSQNNVDVIRCLLAADTPEELVALATDVAAEFSGVVRLKNLFTASEVERAERFHLLPIMLTVVVDAKTTFGELMRQPSTQERLDAYIRACDAAVPPHVWEQTTSMARAMLESPELAEVPVAIFGELQMVLSGHMTVRHKMHEVYKAYRAEHCLLLWEDYARTVSDNLGGGIADLAAPPADQWEAAIRGNAPAMEKFVADGIDLDAIGGPDNSTALLEAAERGYTDVVQVLVKAGASLDLLDPERRFTAVWTAADRGHYDTVKVLIDGNASVDIDRDLDGATPLYMAAQGNYADVVELLLTPGHVSLNREIHAGGNPLCCAMDNRNAAMEATLRAAGAEYVHIHPAILCDGEVCGCDEGLIRGPRWRKLDDVDLFDLCDTAFQELPLHEKQQYELIEHPGSDGIPFTSM